MEHLPATGVKDTEGFPRFLECAAGGFVGLYQKSLKGESTLTPDDITSEIHQIDTWGLKKYMPSEELASPTGRGADFLNQ